MCSCKMSVANLIHKFKYSDIAGNPSNDSYIEAIILMMRVNKMHFGGCI